METPLSQGSYSEHIIDNRYNSLQPNILISRVKDKKNDACKMQAFVTLAFCLTNQMAEPQANRYSEFWILSPGFYNLNSSRAAPKKTGSSSSLVGKLKSSCSGEFKFKKARASHVCDGGL
jgi:hypothetical protein